MRNLERGAWHQINTPNEHKALFGNARVHKGKYSGPGWYMEINYEQSCPRGCCYDSVVELVPAEEVVAEMKEEIRDKADCLKRAKSLMATMTDNDPQPCPTCGNGPPHPNCSDCAGDGWVRKEKHE